jgi:hypothetical protein
MFLYVMKAKKTLNSMTQKKKSAAGNGSSACIQEKAYGDKVPICYNAGCVLRKKAQCSGFEGCPGFRGR